MRYCGHCGSAQRTDQARFCRECGASIGPAPAAPAAPIAPHTPAPAAPIAPAAPAAAPAAPAPIAPQPPAPAAQAPAPAPSPPAAIAAPPTGQSPPAGPPPNYWAAPPGSATAAWPLTGAPVGSPPVAAGGAPPAKGWLGAVLATVAFVVLGGVLPLFRGSSINLVDGGPGAVYVAGIALALCALAVDVAIGSEVALSVAGGVATMVVSLSGIVLAFITELRHFVHVGAGVVFLILAIIPSLALIVGGVARTGRRTSRPVHPALAALSAGGAVLSAVGMLIPPIPHETIKDYLFSAPAVINFFLLLPVILTVACAVLAAACRTAGSVGLAVGNATGLLIIEGADEIVRTQLGQSVGGFLNGEWVVVLVGLAISIAAGAWALLAPSTVAGYTSTEPFARRSGVTPAMVALAAVLIIPLAVSQHSHTSYSNLFAAGASGDSNSSGSGTSGSSGYSSGTSYDTTPPTDYPSSPDTYGTTPPTDYTSPDTTNSSPTAAAVMSDLATDLSQSASVRPNVQNALNDVQSCNGSTSTDESTIQDAINIRQSILSDLKNVDPSNLDNGSEVVSDLTAAMNDSVTADEGFLSYVQDVASGTVSCNADPTTDSSYNDAMNASTQATADKNSFVQIWNLLAPGYNEQTYQAGDF